MAKAVKRPSADDTDNCTIFTVSRGDKVLFGNNVDPKVGTGTDSYYWVSPAGGDRYSGIYLGKFDGQTGPWWTGINEKGLIYAPNGVRQTAPLTAHPELPSPAIDDSNPLGRFILSNSATVKEAIELVKSHNWYGVRDGEFGHNIHLADPTGDAVVFNAGPGKEMSFVRKEPGDGFLASTNFNIPLHQGQDNAGRCWRYDKATEMLQQIRTEDDLTVEYVRDILNATHRRQSEHFPEGPGSFTLFSNIFDVKNQTMYLYHLHQYDEVAVVSMPELLANQTPPTRIATLFSQGIQERGESSYGRRVQAVAVRVDAGPSHRHCSPWQAWSPGQANITQRSVGPPPALER